MSELEITHTDSRFGPQAPNASAELLCEYLKTKLTKQVMLNQFTFPFHELNSTLYFLEKKKKIKSQSHVYMCSLEIITKCTLSVVKEMECCLFLSDLKLNE